MNRFTRSREGEAQRATSLELFYDLVFVFAITQISHLLLTHLTWEGADQSVVVLMVVWWAWNYTTWVTNELDPESPVVRLLIVGLMLGSMLMAVAIPEAFGDHALLFAGSYVAIQVGRHLFLTFVASAAGTIERTRAGRILIWFCAAGVLWIAGALAGGGARTALWVAALAVDYGGPVAVYWVPGLPRIQSAVWNVATGHFAERFQLFIIIALGESIVITGATTSQLELTGAAAAGVRHRVPRHRRALVALLQLRGARGRAAARAGRRERTALARDGYTYLHALMVAGVVVSAVGDELVIAHPTHVLPAAEVAAVVAGPAIYLLAHVLFRLRMAGSLSAKRLVGAVACVACAPIGACAPALVLAALPVLVPVIAAEHSSGGRRIEPVEQLTS
jgi:low temperature requirement protein LtrA